MFVISLMLLNEVIGESVLVTWNCISLLHHFSLMLAYQRTVDEALTKPLCWLSSCTLAACMCACTALGTSKSCWLFSAGTCVWNHL